MFLEEVGPKNLRGEEGVIVLLGVMVLVGIDREVERTRRMRTLTLTLTLIGGGDKEDADLARLKQEMFNTISSLQHSLDK